MKDPWSILEKNGDFVVKNGIPRHQDHLTSSQQQTSKTFGYKWSKRDTYESEHVQTAVGTWLREKYGLTNYADILALVKGKRILDAGCGASMSALLLFGDSLREAEYLGVDVSASVDVAAQRFRERNIPAQFVQVSLTKIPEELGNFDIIFSEGVLHHTDSTEKSFRSLAKRLNPGGTIMFYVYQKKGPLREFSDDAIRHEISTMSDEEAWNTLLPLTKLGRTLGQLNIEIDIEEPIDVLKIPAGKINIQRLFYWHIAKIYYREEWTLDEMNHVNFDWYRPSNCFRHTADEIRYWIADSGLEIKHFHLQEAGITAVARAPD